jgi:hypothetical protein
MPPLDEDNKKGIDLLVENDREGRTKLSYNLPPKNLEPPASPPPTLPPPSQQKSPKENEQSDDNDAQPII